MAAASQVHSLSVLESDCSL